MATEIPLVFCITLNWNHFDDTFSFLTSCARQTYPRIRILVVDNGSTDGSAAEFGIRCPGVEQISNPANLGFAGGMNAGMRYALTQGADFLFVANNDVILAPDTITLLVRAALACDSALTGPAIYHTAQPERIWSAGAWRNPLTLELATAWPGGPAGEPIAVDYACAGAVLISRACLEQIGLFDERFFMYYEDNDYCLRARAAGLRIYIVPGASAWHKVAASSGGVDSPGERYHMALSSVLFFRKHVRGWRWAVVLPYRSASAVKTVFRLCHGRHAGAARSYLAGLVQGLRA